MRVQNGIFRNQNTSNFFRPTAQLLLRSWCSQKMEDFPTQEDHQARFYEHYREVAERHDKEFLKKHDEDLNTTLIFVSSSSGFGGRALIRGAGWFILCSYLRIHHTG